MDNEQANQTTADNAAEATSERIQRPSDIPDLVVMGVLTQNNQHVRFVPGQAGFVPDPTFITYRIRFDGQYWFFLNQAEEIKLSDADQVVEWLLYNILSLANGRYSFSCSVGTFKILNYAVQLGNNQQSNYNKSQNSDLPELIQNTLEMYYGIIGFKKL